MARTAPRAQLSLAAAMPAQAADLPTTATPTARRPVAANYNWTGGYIGGNIGYSWGSWDSTGFVQNGSNSPSVNGILGGLQLGGDVVERLGDDGVEHRVGAGD